MSEQDTPAESTFTPIEARILACLMEKQLTTPDNYPLTENSLVTACNQKSNREPVMHLTPGEVGHTVNTLADRELVKIEYGDRANRVFHRMSGAFSLDRKQQAILAVLMVRTTPQTLNELRSRTGRMVEFDGNEEVRQTVEGLVEREDALLVCLPKGPGRREDRYAHTLCGPVDMEAPIRSNATAGAPTKNDRIEELEQRVAELERQVAELTERVGEG